MAKKKKQKVNKKPPVAKVSIQELCESRDGGQIALRGYSYQFLYSCTVWGHYGNLPFSIPLSR